MAIPPTPTSTSGDEFGSASALRAPVEPVAADHAFEIIRDEQIKRGWYLSWRCPTKGCGSAGNSTTPSRETAMQLFELVAEGHKKIVAGEVI